DLVVGDAGPRREVLPGPDDCETAGTVLFDEVHEPSGGRDALPGDPHARAGRETELDDQGGRGVPVEAEVDRDPAAARVQLPAELAERGGDPHLVVLGAAEGGGDLPAGLPDGEDVRFLGQPEMVAVVRHAVTPSPPSSPRAPSGRRAWNRRHAAGSPRPAGGRGRTARAGRRGPTGRSGRRSAAPPRLPAADRRPAPGPG